MEGSTRNSPSNQWQMNWVDCWSGTSLLVHSQFSHTHTGHIVMWLVRLLVVFHFSAVRSLSSLTVLELMWRVCVQHQEQVLHIIM